MNDEASRWPALERLLQREEPAEAAVEQRYPGSAFYSYFRALETLEPALAEATRSAGRRLFSATRLADCPILAVTGMLNAGKTSLVSSFLSPAGQRRTLRGQAHREGTHRFVLWLPERWRQDAELWGLLKLRLGDALGAPPEDLSEDPEAAHLQYNNRHGQTEHVSIALLATDPRLDEIGMGLLDCPDTVTTEHMGLGSPEQRLALLRKASPLCSAFIVVSAFSSLRDHRLAEVLKTVAEAMPHVHRYLAINMVRPRYAPEEVLQDAGAMLRQYQLKQVYVAYDFEIPESAKYRPDAALPDTGFTDTTSDSFPRFFVPSERPEANLRGGIEAARCLASLPRQLDVGELFKQMAIDLHRDVGRAVTAGTTRLQELAARTQQQVHVQQQTLLDAALEFMVAVRAPDHRIRELRLLQNPRIAQQLLDAFTSAAPWYAWVPLKIHQGVRTMTNPFVMARENVVRWLRGGAVKEGVDEVSRRIHSGDTGKLLTPESLAKVIQQVGGTGPLLPHDAPEEDWVQRCREVVIRLEQEITSTLDTQLLDQIAQDVWQNIPATKKLGTGVTALTAAVAAFGAVLLLPIDGGVTVIAAASIKELLVAAGFSTVGVWWAGQNMQRAFAGSTAVQQLADFVAALCDAFSVPRPEDTGHRLSVPMTAGVQPLPASSLQTKLRQDQPLRLFRVQEAFEKQVQRWTHAGSSGWFGRLLRS